MPSIEQLTKQAEMDSFSKKANERLIETKKNSEEEEERKKIKIAQEAESNLIEIKKKKEETDEEKLRRITDATFDTEEAIGKVLEEKVPFEQRKEELELEIERAEKKLELITERKERIEEVKKTIEGQENASQNIEEKRTFEKERWKIEDQRNDVVLEQEEKEDEIKSLRAQLNECEYNFEKIISKERELNLELEILRRDREDILLEQQKRTIQTDLEKVETEAFAVKDRMFENTKLKSELEKNLSEIKNKERLSEEEIKILEKRTDAAGTENEIRSLEQQRKNAEKTRRDIETERWKIEDSLAKAEKEREKLKERYQTISGEVKTYRDKISNINIKKEQNIKIQISQISDRVKNKPSSDEVTVGENDDENEEE
jgi:predicted  nucleic acid-binding Zn-ribbon protein